MSTFDTPQPIFVTIELSVGDIRIVATDRVDTTVEVRPRDQSKELDIKAAERTQVEYSNGRLLVQGQKPRGFFGRVGFVEIAIAVPTGSHVYSKTPMVDFHSEGRLGECEFTTDAGSIRVDQAGPLRLKTSLGKIAVNQSVGRTEITGSGDIQIHEIDGVAVVKNLNGDIRIGKVTEDLRVKTANGGISVEHAQAGVDAKTANGSIRIGEVVRGSVAVATAYGDLEVGIREGTAAWLDIKSSYGKVRNSLSTSDTPGQSEETVKIRARTSAGDITIRRSAKP
jgi:DUF4097 and DUF4098 domain-containing protein YvlB